MLKKIGIKEWASPAKDLDTVRESILEISVTLLN